MRRCLSAWWLLAAPWCATLSAAIPQNTLEALDRWFASPADQRPAVPEHATDVTFANRDEAASAASELWQSYRRGALAQGWDKQIAELPPTPEELRAMPADARPKLSPSSYRAGGRTMPYFLLPKGKKPATGWPLILSLHGGGSSGGTSGAHDWPVNTREWQAQLMLFEQVYPAGALYLIPRMADDNEGRWWFDACQEIYRQLVRRALLFREVDPARVMVMGISEGGYAAFRLPANQPGVWAAAGAMAAAEPIDTSPPQNLMHTALRCDIGAGDTMFNRVGLARDYFKQLDQLRTRHPGSYPHELAVQDGRGHGIDYSACAPWLLKHTRNPRPKEIVWRAQPLHQTLHRHHHWLELRHNPTAPPLDLHASIEGQKITVTIHDATGKPAHGIDLRILLDDALLDPGQPVELVVNGRRTTHPAPGRRLATMAATLASRGDPQMVFTSEINTTSP